MNMDTPILVITFNRPDHLRRVIEALRLVEPTDIYFFQDGPRTDHPEDICRCAEVRGIIERLSWRCHKEFLFSEENLGCGPGPAKAISWFFDRVDSGIILEDDAVPHPDFFDYASELLERYKSDSSIRAIGSMNVDTRRWGDGSYYYSMMNRNLCAWATWKRAWDSFDISLRDVSRRELAKALKKYKCGRLERSYWCDRLDEIHKDGCGGQSWDMQFLMSIWINHGKGIIPNVNLSSNIGTVGEATHAMGAGNLIDNIPARPILPIQHPTSALIQNEADKVFHYRYFEPNKREWSSSKITYYLLNKRLKKLLNHTGPWLKKN